MSCGNHHQLPCTEVLHAVVLYIDHEIDNAADLQAIELHIQECPPCAERAAHEALLNQQLKGLLNRSCREEASEQLRSNVNAIIRQSSGQGYVQRSQSISYTEITADSFMHTRIEIHEQFEEEE